MTKNRPNNKYTMNQKVQKAIDKNDKNEQRTTLSLSLSASDKKALKMRSLKENKTIASIVHEWIDEWKDEIIK